jgi:hypothetical protein
MVISFDLIYVTGILEGPQYFHLMGKLSVVSCAVELFVRDFRWMALRWCLHTQRPPPEHLRGLVEALNEPVGKNRPR